jgi:hypothetical protein
MNLDNNHIDDFVKQVVKKATLEKPGNEFVPSLMDKINELKPENIIINVSPIISRGGWFIIAFIIMSVFAMLFLFGSTTLSFPDYSFSFNNIISTYSVINIPKVFLVGLLAFVFYFIIQIYVIVKQTNNIYT